MKKNKLYILALALGFLSFKANAQTQMQDTVKVSALEEVVITGSRTETSVKHLSQTVSVIERSKIEQRLQPSLLPMLTEQVPGLFITSRGVMGYGVSNGAAGGISLRGLSGGSARVMVLIDGHPQYAGIFGHPVSDAYQSLLADKVEVLRGPASVLYGSNAMGGVINVVTRKMEEDGVKTNLKAAYGSYNTLETELTNRIKKGKFSSVVSGSYNRTDGHRENMEFEQYGGYAKLGYEISDKWNAYADVNITRFNSIYPGPESAPLLEGDQRITRGVASVAIANKYDRTSGGLNLFYNWGKHWINDGYTPSNGESPQDGRFNSFDDMMGISLHQSANLFTGNRITLGFDCFRYGGEAWTEYIKGNNAGSRSDLVNKHENEVAGYMDFRQDFGRWLTFNAGLRIDHHSRVGTETVPQIGLSFHLPQHLEMKLSANKGFRYPILREMYMFPPQNPNLKPEKLWNYEFSLSQSLLESRLKYGVNLFYIDGENLIMTLPNPSGSGMLNQNSGEIKNTGIELQAAYRICTAWSVDANYSWLKMENPVVGAPQHKAYAGANFIKNRFSASTGLSCIAGLYTTAPSNSNPEGVQETFTLWNLRAAYKIAEWISVQARGENLLNHKYEINAGYPMPGATFMLGVNIEF